MKPVQSLLNSSTILYDITRLCQLRVLLCLAALMATMSLNPISTVRRSQILSITADKHPSVLHSTEML